MRVAIFDFDGTLYEKETFRILMNHLKEHPIYHTKYRRFLITFIIPYIAYKIKLYPEDKLKIRSMSLYLSVLGNLSKREFSTYFKVIAKEMQQDFNPEVLALLEEHRTNNIHTMLVSGAYTSLIQAATKGLNFNTVIGTNIPFKNESFDTTAPIYHIQGERKNEMIYAALEDKEIDWKNSFAYADSYSDLPVLELVGNPVAVQPEQRLRTIAEERIWKII